MAFDGFDRDLVTFLADLAGNNKKDWFEASKDRYRRVFVAAGLDFITAFEPVAAALDPPLQAVAKTNGSLRRIHRDVRFSKDKRPYHSHMHLIFWSGDHPNRSPGFHLVPGDEGLGMGAGHWAMDGEQLRRYRAAVCDGKAAADLVAAIETARAGGGGALDEPHLARLPKGFDAAEEHADLLRYKGLVVRTTVPYPDAFFGPQAVDYIADRARIYQPLVKWMTERVYA